MSDNKKYYYLKLKDNFFDSEELKVLESMPDGYKFSNILLKLYLRSLKSEGKLMLNDRIPYDSSMLSAVTGHSAGDIEKAVQQFRKLGLIDVLPNGAIYLLDIQNFIGTSSTEADRKRKFRAKIDSDRGLKLPDGTFVRQTSDNRPPEIEIELEIEKEIYKDNMSVSAKRDAIPYQEIIDFLNQKTNKSYRASTPSTKKLIKARFTEGFSLDDFKKVITNKCNAWLKDANMGQYLRPQTLFGTKFESYLNDGPKNQSKGERVYE